MVIYLQDHLFIGVAEPLDGDVEIDAGVAEIRAVGVAEVMAAQGDLLVFRDNQGVGFGFPAGGHEISAASKELFVFLGAAPPAALHAAVGGAGEGIIIGFPGAGKSLLGAVSAVRHGKQQSFEELQRGFQGRQQRDITGSRFGLRIDQDGPVRFETDGLPDVDHIGTEIDVPGNVERQGLPAAKAGVIHSHGERAAAVVHRAHQLQLLGRQDPVGADGAFVRTGGL